VSFRSRRDGREKRFYLDTRKEPGAVNAPEAFLLVFSRLPPVCSPDGNCILACEDEMKRRSKTEGLWGIARELGLIARRGRQVWRLVPWRHRLALAGALLVMSLASAANTAIALGLGKLIDAVNPKDNPGRTPGV